MRIRIFSAAMLLLAAGASAGEGAAPDTGAATELVLKKGNLEAHVVRWPQPTYPARAAEQSLVGFCDVRFDLDADGCPRNMTPHCSDAVFCQSAATAMAAARFRPRIVNGTPVAHPNVVFPLEYRIDGVPPASPDPRTLTVCP
ncbi:energy transducer TonB [Hyphomonas sp.]|uniref:energy transducer TonB n=1 Tax=Hyphomonas sp. TaxID=87 RepID=UPI00391A3583